MRARLHSAGDKVAAQSASQKSLGCKLAFAATRPI